MEGNRNDTFLKHFHPNPVPFFCLRVSYISLAFGRGFIKAIYEKKKTMVNNILYLTVKDFSSLFQIVKGDKNVYYHDFYLTIHWRLESKKRNKRYKAWDFPGGPVTKTLNFQCRRPKFYP